MTRTLCAVLAALLAGALAAVPARAGQADMTIKIAGFPGGGTGFLITVAEKEGFFQKHGLRRKYRQLRENTGNAARHFHPAW